MFLAQAIKTPILTPHEKKTDKPQLFVPLIKDKNHNDMNHITNKNENKQKYKAT